MQYLISALLTLGITVGFYNYVPLDWVSFNTGAPQLGSTITTILGTDTLSSSRSVINTNFANLNADKIEATQTTLNSLTTATALSSIGTITSGTWNGSVIQVPYGGTGWDSIQANTVLYGNGTGKIATTAPGVNGYFLQLNGSGVPTWAAASTDVGASYLWTGVHNFTGSAIYIKNLLASSTVANPLTLNTLAYSFPSTRAASSTVLTENGSGALVWQLPPVYTLCVDSTRHSVSGTAATTTAEYCTIPANTLTTNSNIEIYATLDNTVNAAFAEIQFGNGSATTSLGSIWRSGSLRSMLSATSTSAQVATTETVLEQSPNSIFRVFPAYSTTGKLYVQFDVRPSSAGSGSAEAVNFLVKVNKQ